MQCLRAERLVFIMGYLVAAGATGRLLFGYDSFGNVCGKKNSPVEGAPLSGQDMTLKKHVFFMNSCNLEVKDARLGSTVLCVSSCPEEQLHTLEEVQLFANTSGAAQVIGVGQAEYKPLSGIRYTWWYHLIGPIWTGEFLVACQQMAIAGAVVTCYFNSAWSRRVFRCCGCCFWCLDKCLRHLNQNAYTATAINGTDFCTSAKDALRLLSKNSSHFTAVNCFGDFIIFLGKHSFLSVFETVLDALFLCFAVDLETNDGSSEKPYFMDREFRSFVERINKLNTARAQRGKNSPSNREGTELQPLSEAPTRYLYLESSLLLRALHRTNTVLFCPHCLTTLQD